MFDSQAARIRRSSYVWTQMRGNSRSSTLSLEGRWWHNHRRSAAVVHRQAAYASGGLYPERGNFVGMEMLLLALACCRMVTGVPGSCRSCRVMPSTSTFFLDHCLSTASASLVYTHVSIILRPTRRMNTYSETKPAPDGASTRVFPSIIAHDAPHPGAPGE